MSNRIVCFFLFCGLIASASAQSSLPRYNFTVGGGPGIGRQDVASYVGDSSQATFGAGINFTRMFAADAEYMYYDLDFRPSVIKAQALPGQSGHMQSFSLDGIVNAPFRFHNLGAYGILGLGFYDRSVALAHSQVLTVDTPCQPAWRWWDITCINNNPPNPPTVYPQQTQSSNSRIAGGFNYGAGIDYRLDYLHHAKIFFEFRYHRAYQADGETIIMPITLGLKW